MAELSGRKAIADHLGVTCGEVSRLVRWGLPVIYKGYRMIGSTEGLDAWKREHGDRKGA
jgi:hypothetical protein